jgi:hypothetical protein
VFGARRTTSVEGRGGVAKLFDTRGYSKRCWECTPLAAAAAATAASLPFAIAGLNGSLCTMLVFCTPLLVICPPFTPVTLDAKEFTSIVEVDEELVMGGEADTEVTEPKVVVLPLLGGDMRTSPPVPSSNGVSSPVDDGGKLRCPVESDERMA